MRRAPLFLCILALAACRTTRPPAGAPLAPLTSSSPADAARELAARRSQFEGERSLIRIRIPMGQGSITTRGQLQVDGARRMLLTLYTPLGTTAARLYSEGDEVVFLNDLQSTAWRGKAVDMAGGFGLFGALAPETVALLLVGLPPPEITSVSYSATGIAEVRLEDTVVTFDPSVYPPKGITIDRGGRKMTIEHLQSAVDLESLKRPEIPRDYRCCVLPGM